MKKGCLFSILGVVLVLLLAIILLRGRMMEDGVKGLKEKIVHSLPPNYARARVDSVFDEFKVALKEKRIENGKAQEAIKYIKEALKDKRLTRDEVDHILHKLREAIRR